MGFSSIRFHNFRNLQNAKVSVEAPEIFLIGKNGQGKTNFLEAVYLLCYGSSFRTKKDSSYLRFNTDLMVLEGVFNSEMDIKHHVSLRIDKSEKDIKINGEKIQDRKDLVYQFPCVVFCHEDITIVSGPPERQRWFFNQTLGLLDELFIDLLRNYNKIVRLRNQTVKDLHYELIDIYDEQLAATGIEIQKKREKIIDEFNRVFLPVVRDVSGLQEPVSIRYRPSWPSKPSLDTILRELRDSRDKDIALGFTTSGPHRDKIIFNKGENEFASTASTGQLRLLSLVLRLSQASLYYKKTNREPVLLLDDVLLELDLGKRLSFFEHLPRYDQAFFTFLPDEQFSSYKKSQTMVYSVIDGAFSHEKSG